MDCHLLQIRVLVAAWPNSPYLYRIRKNRDRKYGLSVVPVGATLPLTYHADQRGNLWHLRESC